MSDQEKETWKSLAGICANLCTSGNDEFHLDTNGKMIKNILKHNNCIDCPIPGAPYFQQKEEVKLNGERVLHLAMKKGNLKAFKFLIDQGADYTLKNPQGETILHQAFQQSPYFSVQSGRLWVSAYDSYMHSVLSAQVKSQNTSNPCNDNGWTHMHIACAINHVQSVEFFLMNGVSVSQAIDFKSPSLPGYSPLHIAIKYRAYETASMLLKHGADLNLKDAQGISPLHLLIKLNISINSPEEIHKNKSLSTSIFDVAMRANNSSLIIDENGLTALHVACTLRDTPLVEELFKLGHNIIDLPVNKDSPLFSGYTALHFAAHFSVETLKLLVNNGGNIASKDSKGTTPFDIFLKRNDTFACDVAVFIASQPSWRKTRFTGGKTSLLDFVSAMQKEGSLLSLLGDLNSINAPLQLDSPLWPGYTILHLLVLLSFKMLDNQDFITYDKRLIDAIKLCLEMGADVGIKDVHGDSPLHLACNLQKDELIHLLLSAPNVTNPVNENGLSHLHIACAATHLNFVTRLLDSNCKVDVNEPVGTSWHYMNAVNIAKGSTALHIAVMRGNLELAEILLSHGANCALKNDDGLTSVHLLLGERGIKENLAAAILSSYNSLLASDNACVDAAPACGLTELHVVSYRGDEAAVERLLDLGADIDARITCEQSLVRSLSHLRYYSGCTPLDLAVRRRNNAIVKILLERGADVLAKWDVDGMTPAYAILQNVFMRNDWGKVLVDKLERDVALQDRMLNNSGLTMLHVACALMDFDLIKRLCNDSQGLNVNARTLANSTIWPGCTPLHLLIITSEEHVRADEMDAVKLLLDCGADVTLANSDQKTPIHEDFEHFSVRGPRFANLLLKAQKDFRKNPVSLKEISHFHVACLIKEVAVVEDFLKHGVDVNLPISHFCEIYGGFTPLHLAALHHLKDIFMFLKKRRIDYSHVPDYISSEIQIDPFNVASVNDHKKTVDLLLRHGADLNTRDRTGNTPLHAAFLSETLQEDVGESLIRAGGDWNIENFLDETPLEVMVSLGNITRSSFEFFLRHGGDINSYSPASEEGTIPTIFINCRDKDAVQKYLWEAMSNAPEMNYFDEMGRSLIHNVVSHSKAPFTHRDYISFIEFFEKLGHDIDHRDKKGRTALHVASEFQNWKAVQALLACGADINVFDQRADTALSFIIEELQEFETITRGNSRLIHIRKLELCGIYVDQHLFNICPDFSVRFGYLKKICSDEITLSESMKIEPHTLTLHDFLSDTRVVAAYPVLPLIQREAICDYFRNNDTLLSERFPQLSGVLKLQFRKALARVALLEVAKSALSTLAQFDIPDLCSEVVLRFLNNRDLENLMASADIEL